MFEAGGPAVIRAPDIGHVAMQAMRELVRTRVGAVFRNSFYLETPGPWVCVTGRTTAMGPLSVRLDLPGGTDWRDRGIRHGMPAHVDANFILIHPCLRILCCSSHTWAPASAPDWTPRSLRHGLAFTTRWTRVNLGVDEGLGCLIPPQSDRSSISAVAARAIRPIELLRRWLASKFLDPRGPAAAPPIVINELSGLGPGLTPSGDDFLGGAMVALHLLGYDCTARQIFEAITTNTDIRSNPISASHLEAAAGGSCSAPIHAVLSATLTADTNALPSYLKRIDRIGHTSGRDTLAGALTVLHEWSRGSDVIHQ